MTITAGVPPAGAPGLDGSEEDREIDMGAGEHAATSAASAPRPPSFVTALTAELHASDDMDGDTAVLVVCLAIVMALRFKAGFTRRGSRFPPASSG